MSELVDAAVLARLQFAFTVSFHIIFPAFTIGLASYLAVLEALWLWRGRAIYMVLYRYWLKIFALTFGMGVVSGIVMSYQFGTNWGPFSDRAGPILGPLMGYEVLTAFFLEAGFLGVMLFGLKRVGKGLHFFATCMVALGTLISTFWILAANSWMHTPAGFEIRDGTVRAGRLVGRHLQSVVSLPPGAHGAGRLSHHRVRRGGDRRLASAARTLARAARVMFSMAMWMAAAVAPLQLIVGDVHGLNTLEHQPAKIAAIEGHWETQRGAPLYLFGWPDMQAETTRYGISVPRLGSLILTHDWDGEIQGLKSWPRADRPHAPTVFWSFRVMVGIGVLMLLIGCPSLYLRLRRRLFDHAQRSCASRCGSARAASSRCSRAGSRPRRDGNPTWCTA